MSIFLFFFDIGKLFLYYFSIVRLFIIFAQVIMRNGAVMWSNLPIRVPKNFDLIIMFLTLLRVLMCGGRIQLTLFVFITFSKFIFHWKTKLTNKAFKLARSCCLLPLWIPNWSTFCQKLISRISPFWENRVSSFKTSFGSVIKCNMLSYLWPKNNWK